jgi:hypothetical protein
MGLKQNNDGSMTIINMVCKHLGNIDDSEYDEDDIYDRLCKYNNSSHCAFFYKEYCLFDNPGAKYFCKYYEEKELKMHVIKEALDECDIKRRD